MTIAISRRQKHTWNFLSSNQREWHKHSMPAPILKLTCRWHGLHQTSRHTFSRFYIRFWWAALVSWAINWPAYWIWEDTWDINLLPLAMCLKQAWAQCSTHCSVSLDMYQKYWPSLHRSAYTGACTWCTYAHAYVGMHTCISAFTFWGTQGCI